MRLGLLDFVDRIIVDASLVATHYFFCKRAERRIELWFILEFWVDSDWIGVVLTSLSVIIFLLVTGSDPAISARIPEFLLVQDIYYQIVSSRDFSLMQVVHRQKERFGLGRIPTQHNSLLHIGFLLLTVIPRLFQKTMLGLFVADFQGGGVREISIGLGVLDLGRLDAVIQ